MQRFWEPRPHRLPESGAKSGAARRYLADRDRAGLSPLRRGRRVGAAALGFPAGAAERSADHQFPLRGAALPERPLPDPGLALLRVHRHEIAEIEVEIHQGWRGLVLFCRIVAPDAGGGRGRLHPPDNRARSRCRADSRSADGRFPIAWTGAPGSISPGRNPSCFARFPPGNWRSNRFDSPIWRDRQRRSPPPLSISAEARPGISVQTRPIRAVE